jgi:endonuclease/exonuclease/phosphatase family metal-dependent hydrolase
VAVTPASYARRARQISRVIEAMAPDVIAFQEVSGAAAVLEVLPEGGRDYEVCSFTGFKVQRLAFAWKRRLGALAEPCEAFEPLSLPGLAPADRVRPGLAIGLRIQGQLIRFLSVHLKSSCVSPLESADPNGRGQLAGAHPACVSLQAQLEPLERWLHEKSADGTPVVLMGDFNRHLGHEARQPERAAVRLPAGRASEPYQPGVRSTSLWRELNDGDPPTSRLVLLAARCPGAPWLQALCEAGHERVLSRDETRVLAARDGLGCRNPIGLDHIVLSSALNVLDAGGKYPLGAYGATRRASPGASDPLLAVSDHCPLTAIIGL